MNSELKLFESAEWKVRTVERDGEAWFVAKDICDTLGIRNSKDAIAELESNEKDIIPASHFANVISNEP
jgi:prophage antirepressor-like protein